MSHPATEYKVSIMCHAQRTYFLPYLVPTLAIQSSTSTPVLSFLNYNPTR